MATMMYSNIYDRFYSDEDNSTVNMDDIIEETKDLPKNINQKYKDNVEQEIDNMEYEYHRKRLEQELKRAVDRWSGNNEYSIIYSDHDRKEIHVRNSDFKSFGYSYYEHYLEDAMFDGWKIISREETFNDMRSKIYFRQLLSSEKIFVEEVIIKPSAMDILDIVDEYKNKFGKLTIIVNKHVNISAIKKYIQFRTAQIVTEVRNDKK
jgi:hypothetical protein